MKNYKVYKVTNMINNHIYVGVQKYRPNKPDNYLGSGTNIKKAIKQFGKHNFKKEFLYEYNNQIEMLAKEREIVNEEFIARQDTYNIILGGGEFNMYNCVVVRDKDNNTMAVHVTDPRYLSGELIAIAKYKVKVKDKVGNFYQVDIDDPRYLSGELVHFSTGRVTVRDKKGKIFAVQNNDVRFLSGELVHISKGKIVAQDFEGNKYCVDVTDQRLRTGLLIPLAKGNVVVQGHDGKNFRISLDDPRYLSGEFTPLIKGKLIVKDKEGKTYRLDKNDPRILSGELVHVNKGLTMKSEHKKLRSDKLKGIYVGEKSASYNKCFMHNLNDIQIRIDKSEVKKYLELGWIEGRKKTYKGATGLKNINNGQLTKKVSQEVLQTYLDQGWLLGALKYKKSK